METPIKTKLRIEFPESCSMLRTVSPFVVRFLSAMAFPGGSYGRIEAGVANIVSYFLSRVFDTWNSLNSLRTSRQLRYYIGRLHKQHFMEVIKLRSATPADLTLLQEWDEQAHVIASDPNSDWGWEVELGRNPDWREQMICELDGRARRFGDDECLVYRLDRADYTQAAEKLQVEHR